MRNGLLTLMLTVALCAAMVPAAYAKDEFEKGFKSELGAIAARSAVGFGVGLFNGVFGGGVCHDGYYGTPAGFRQGYTRPYYRERVVYKPYPMPYYRAEHREYYPRPYYVPPPRAHHHYEYRSRDCH
ncbi:MAG: hypothetical protein JSV16_01385 [Candidatus Hydrogenedentota bacterium]|nr:MAG: hypothetical protein JSV16_01385 [Candidatus Hydrogenedentota bacterium]